MTLARIMKELRNIPDTAAPERAARAGFLQWSLSLPAGHPPRAAAHAAMRRLRGEAGTNAAVDWFLHFLNAAATHPGPAAPRRRGGTRGRRAAFH